jgi:hypothetical protein
MPPKRGKGKRGEKGKRSSKGTKKSPVEKLLEEAIQKSYVGFFEDASILFERALAIQPTNVEIIDAFAENCLDAGASDRAKEVRLFAHDSPFSLRITWRQYVEHKVVMCVYSVIRGKRFID